MFTIIDLTKLNLTELSALFVMTYRSIPKMSHNGCEIIIAEMIANAGGVEARAELKRNGIKDNTIDYYIYILNMGK